MRPQFVIPAYLFLALLAGCAAGRRHTTDSELERRFHAHERQFNRLLEDVGSDIKLSSIGRRGVIYAGRSIRGNVYTADMERAGLSRERWESYQQQLEELGLVQIAKGHDAVEFRVDEGSLSNGDSYKGYWYSSIPPRHLKGSLDGYRIKEADKDKRGGYMVSKAFESKWSLYLFVNG